MDRLKSKGSYHSKMMMDGYVASRYTFRDGGQANIIEKIDKHKIH